MDWTVENYSRHIDRFLAQRFGAGPVRFERFRAQDVIAFVQREAGRNGRGYILQVVTGLRSFLRFLRYRGDITTDLAAAVPSVANWQKTDLPKHLSAKHAGLGAPDDRRILVGVRFLRLRRRPSHMRRLEQSDCGTEVSAPDSQRFWKECSDHNDLAVLTKPVYRGFPEQVGRRGPAGRHAFWEHDDLGG